jgi:hypothetical protein
MLREDVSDMELETTLQQLDRPTGHHALHCQQTTAQGFRLVSLCSTVYGRLAGKDMRLPRWLARESSLPMARKGPQRQTQSRQERDFCTGKARVSTRHECSEGLGWSQMPKQYGERGTSQEGKKCGETGSRGRRAVGGVRRTSQC